MKRRFTPRGSKIDFIMTRPEHWNARQLERRRRVRLQSGHGEFDIWVAAPEDVILGKLWYYSEGGGDRHLRDIAAAPADQIALQARLAADYGPNHPGPKPRQEVPQKGQLCPTPA